MKKTIYTVTFRTWGMDSAATKWFDNREDAYKFYDSANDNLRVDRPVAHRLSNPARIAEAEAIIEDQREWEAWNAECEAIATSQH